MKSKETTLIFLLLILLLFCILECFHKINDEETNQYVNWKNRFNYRKSRRGSSRVPRRIRGEIYALCP